MFGLAQNVPEERLNWEPKSYLTLTPVIFMALAASLVDLANRLAGRLVVVQLDGIHNIPGRFLHLLRKSGFLLCYDQMY